MSEETNKIKIVTMNRLRAVKVMLERYMETASIPTIKEMSDKHNITNITLLRRFANPIKNPDPLSATMISLSYKYPIIMKEEYKKMFPTEIIEKYIEKPRERRNEDKERKKIVRRPGWVGCKKELVDKYLDIAEVPNAKQIDIINVLYHNDREKVKGFKRLDWENAKILMGRQIGDKARVNLNNPLIPNLKQGEILPLLCKILTPGIECSKKIQKIYDENKKILSDEIPSNVSIIEQANTLRALLDPKERVIPILSTKFDASYYQHTTSLFSSTWQARALESNKEEGEFNIPFHYSVEGIAQKFIHIMYVNDFAVNPLLLARSMFVGNNTFYDMIENSTSSSVAVGYLKRILEMKTKNVIILNGIHGNVTLKPQKCVISNDEIHQNIHFKTSLTEGVCLIRSSTLTINMRWATYRIMLEILVIFVYLQKINLSERISGNFIKNAWAYAKEINLSQYIIGSTMTQKYKEMVNNTKKFQIGNMVNLKMTTDNSPYEIIIDDNIVSLDPITMSEVTPSNETVPVFVYVNKMHMINISHFVDPTKKGEGYCDRIEGEIFMNIEFSAFLQMAEFKTRYLYIYFSIHQDSKLYQNILNENFVSFGDFFRDYLEERQLDCLAYLCTLSLRVIKERGEIGSMSRELLAFYFIWANHDSVYKTTGIILMEYFFKNGSIIDLTFKPETQHAKNLFWIDEDDEVRVMEEKAGKSVSSLKNEPKIQIIQGQLQGFRIAIKNDEEESDEKIYTFENAKRLLSNKKDESKVLVSHMGVCFVMTRDRTFTYKTGKSGVRMTQALKRAIYLDPGRMESVEISAKRPRIK